MRVSALLSALLSASTALAAPSCGGNLVVNTSEGKVRGVHPAGYPSVRQFAGIPYAQPPVKDLRWAPPKPAAARKELHDGSKIGPSCPQIFENWNPSVYTRDVIEFNIGGQNKSGPVSEDCLTLTVWAPSGTKAKPAHKLPVLVYLFGGSFTNGGVDIPYQNPTQWVARSQQHIVVVLNYRLSIFGFPSSAALPLDGHNLGLLDQRLAVEWVHKNIASFGGDPERMVLWGQSAGAMSVASYSYAYPKNPLVKGLIQNSGSEGVFNLLHTTPDYYSNFTFVASNVGCAGLASKPAEELACMRKVPFEKINAFRAEWSKSKGKPSLTFAPFYDNVTIFSNFAHQAKTVGIANIPLILGTNTGDWLGLYGADGIDQVQAAELKKRIFLCTAHASAQNRADLHLPTFRYLYAGNFSNVSPRPWMGAYHQSEIPLLFGTHANYRGNSTELEYETSHALQDSWVAFAKGGEAGMQEIGWPRWDNNTGHGVVRRFGDGDAEHTGPVDPLEAQC